ncbi:MAG: hypothetical protein M3Q68_10650, partial [Actinomycetota bacterium]|nr:hypothetical protein [Actinomycetota bacterium]
MRAGSIELAEAKGKGTATSVFLQYFFTYQLGGRAGHGYEIAFARDGDPNHAALPKWTSYTSAERATMVFGHDTHVEDDPSGSARELWSRLNARGQLTPPSTLVTD